MKPPIKKNSTALSWSYGQTKYGSTSLCDQNCGLQSEHRHTDTHTNRHTDTWTDKSLKTEGPKILSIDIFYFKNVIIGGPIPCSTARNSQCDTITLSIMSVTNKALFRKWSVWTILTRNLDYFIVRKVLWFIQYNTVPREGRGALATHAPPPSIRGKGGLVISPGRRKKKKKNLEK